MAPKGTATHQSILIKHFKEEPVLLRMHLREQTTSEHQYTDTKKQCSKMSPLANSCYLHGIGNLMKCTGARRSGGTLPCKSGCGHLFFQSILNYNERKLGFQHYLNVCKQTQICILILTINFMYSLFIYQFGMIQSEC